MGKIMRCIVGFGHFFFRNQIICAFIASLHIPIGVDEAGYG